MNSLSSGSITSIFFEDDFTGVATSPIIDKYQHVFY